MYYVDQCLRMIDLEAPPVTNFTSIFFIILFLDAIFHYSLSTYMIKKMKKKKTNKQFHRNIFTRATCYHKTTLGDFP